VQGIVLGVEGKQRRRAYQSESMRRRNEQNAALKLQIGQRDSNICPAREKHSSEMQIS